MKFTKLSFLFIALAAVSACTPATNTNGSNAANIGAANSAASPEKQVLTEVERPQKIKDMMAARGQQDEAKPTLKILEPKADSTVTNSTVKVKLALSGDLKGYKPMMDEATHTGNHIHVILDNQPIVYTHFLRGCDQVCVAKRNTARSVHDSPTKTFRHHSLWL